MIIYVNTSDWHHHAAWFAQTIWSLHTNIISLEEPATIEVAVLRLDYRDEPPGQKHVYESSYVTLIFALRDGRWVMTHDQYTPIKTNRDVERSA